MSLRGAPIRREPASPSIVAGPDDAVDLAEASLLIACEEYPDLDVARYLERLDAHGARACAARLRDAAAGPRSRALERLPLRRGGLPRQHRGLLRPAQQLPERRARPPHGHPHHALRGLHGGGAARRARRGGRRACPATSSCGSAARRRRRAGRPVPRRRACSRRRTARSGWTASTAGACSWSRRCSPPARARRSWPACCAT